MERIAGMILLVIASIALMLADAPIPGVVCFGVAFALAVTHSPFNFSLFSPKMNARPHAQAEPEIHHLIHHSKVVEATEQRVERPDGSAIQVRQVRQWH